MTSPVAHTSTIPARLRYLAWVMDAIGIDMEYYGGFGPMANRGQDLLRSAAVVRTWADNIEWLSGSQYAGEAEEPEDEAPGEEAWASR